MKKNILLYHDFSLYTKSSLSVCLPIAEAMGGEVASLPSAILSTQTDGFDNVYSIDTYSHINNIVDKYVEYGFSFSAFYSGYIATINQEQSILYTIDKLVDGIVLIDPVLGDSGALYSNFTQDNIELMKRLIKHADIITPNYTEALLLTGLNETNSIEEIIEKLKELTSANIVITSVKKDNKLINVSYSNEITCFEYEEEKHSYPGCGDLFATILLSSILNGSDFTSSVKTSGDIVTSVIKKCIKSNREYSLGVDVSIAIRTIYEDLL